MHTVQSSRLLGRALVAVLAVGVALLLVDRPSSAGVGTPDEVRFDVLGPVSEFRSGNKAVVVTGDEAQTKKNLELLTKLAKFLTWRIANAPYNGDQAARKDEKSKPTPEKETMQFLLNEADTLGFTMNNRNPDGSLRPNQVMYANEFGKIMQAELEYVLNESTKSIERVNAVRMMALAAEKLPYAGFADSFMKILKNDRYPDGLRVYAYQGLRNILAHSLPSEPGKHVLSEPQLVEIATYLEAVVLRQYTLPKPGEENAAHVIQFIRRYAIQALGQYKDAVLRNKRKEVLARPGQALIIAAAPMTDKTRMPYSPAERIDAVIGFCQMKVDESMNLEAAVFWINEAMLDITSWHGTEKDNVAKTGGKPTIPWKIASARIIESLNNWKKNMKDVKAAWDPKQVTDYVEKAVPVLQKMESEGIKANLETRDLIQWQKNHVPKDPVVFREVKKEE